MAITTNSRSLDDKGKVWFQISDGETTIGMGEAKATLWLDVLMSSEADRERIANSLLDYLTYKGSLRKADEKRDNVIRDKAGKPVESAVPIPPPDPMPAAKPEPAKPEPAKPAKPAKPEPAKPEPAKPAKPAKPEPAKPAKGKGKAAEETVVKMPPAAPPARPTPLWTYTVANALHVVMSDGTVTITNLKTGNVRTVKATAGEALVTA